MMGVQLGHRAQGKASGVNPQGCVTQGPQTGTGSERGKLPTLGRFGSGNGPCGCVLGSGHVNREGVCGLSRGIWVRPREVPVGWQHRQTRRHPASGKGKSQLGSCPSYHESRELRGRDPEAAHEAPLPAFRGSAQSRGLPGAAPQGPPSLKGHRTCGSELGVRVGLRPNQDVYHGDSLTAHPSGG